MGSGLSDSVGTGLGPLASYALAAVIVLVLVVVVLVVAKRVMGSNAVGVGAKRGPRLAVLDVTAVDQRRKLVLVRRDDVEHLVLIGGQNDLVVEKGIVRTPQSLRNSGGEWTEGRAPPSPPLPIAPQPRAPVGASPLRRPVPRTVPEPVRAVPVEPAVDQDEAPSPAVVSNAGRLSRIEDERPRPMPSMPDIATTDDMVETEMAVDAEETPQPEPQVDTPPPVEPTVVPVRQETRGPLRPPVPPAEPAEPRIPAFLRRADPPAPPVPDREPEPLPPLPPELPRTASPAPFAFQKPPRNEAETVPVQRPETPPVAYSPPIFPTLKTPPPVAPEPSVDRAETAEPLPQTPRPQPPAPPVEDAEKRPLAVRSFATTIQSRRSNFEPSRANPAAERPPAPVQPAPPPAPEPAIPSFLQATSAAAVAPKPESLSLEDELSQTLNSDFGSVDWPEEKPGAGEPVVASAPTEAPAPQVVHVKPAERELTLEEEMERLLSDFDFGDRRR